MTTTPPPVDNLGAGQNRMTEKSSVNHSRFRKRYRELSPAELAWNDAIKDAAAKLEALYVGLGGSRYQALALTQLETSVMYGVKQLTGERPINPATGNPYSEEEIQTMLQQAAKAVAD